MGRCLRRARRRAALALRHHGISTTQSPQVWHPQHSTSSATSPKTPTPQLGADMRSRYLNIWRFACLSTGIFSELCASPAAHATPLDAEACIQLKSQRDALAATGLGEVLRQRPPERRADIPPERAKQVRTLISLDGQLRFRCGIDLLLPTLKPDPVEEFVDAGDTATARPPARAPAKKAKAAKAAPAEAATPAAAAGTQAPQAPKTAAAAEQPAPKAAPKPKPKTDDAFRAAPGSDPTASTLDKQLPKSQ
jgi:hypothetical protein